MKSENWNEIQNLIRKYRTWIDVLDTDKGEDFYFVVSGTIRICHQRVLRLVTKWPFKKYPRGHVFIIPEYELDKAIRHERHNKHFTTRMLNCKPTPQDIEVIIHKASLGHIKLNLEVY